MPNTERSILLTCCLKDAESDVEKDVETVGVCSLVRYQYREKRRYKEKEREEKRERELIGSTIENTNQNVRDERTCEGGCCVQTPCPVSIAEILCLPQFLVGIQTH